MSLIFFFGLARERAKSEYKKKKETRIQLSNISLAFFFLSLPFPFLPPIVIKCRNLFYCNFASVIVGLDTIMSISRIRVTLWQD